MPTSSSTCAANSNLVCWMVRLVVQMLVADEVAVEAVDRVPNFKLKVQSWGKLGTGQALIKRRTDTYTHAHAHH